MVGMVLLSAAGGLVVVSFIVLWVLRRRGDQQHSVDGYRRTLSTLQDVRSRSMTGSSVRILGSSGTADPGPTRNGPAFDPHEALGVGSGPAARGARATQRRRERAIAHMSKRPRRLGGPLAAAAVVIAAVTGLAIAGAHSRHPHHNTTTTTTSPSHHQGHSRPAPPTTTTFPKTFVASASTSTTATYAVPRPSYTVNVTASGGACWVEVTNSAGTTVVAQTLAAGQHQAIPLTGDSRMVLGAPSSVRVQVDTSPVVLPGGIFELLFQVPTPTTTTTTTPVTTTT